jgi:solute carrier family 35 protein E1
VPALSLYLLLWYAFNAGFNVTNKLVLNQFPHPWVVSWVQLATGLLFVLPSWFSGLRAPPKVDKKLLWSFLPIALLHSSGHASQVAAMGFGSVFFTHVIKASEPFIGTLVVLVATGKIAPWYVNACLLPVVGGVAYAAAKPGAAALDFSQLWALPSLLAFASTVAFAVAKLLAKQQMTPQKKKDANLHAANNYALLTCCSASVLFLPSMLAEGPQALASFAAMGPSRFAFAQDLLVCGGFYYAYNEMGFRVLDLLSPVSAAIANSAKRVVILFAAVLFLGETVTQRKLVGASIALGGVTLYSVMKAVASKQSKKGPPKKATEGFFLVKGSCPYNLPWNKKLALVEGTDAAGSWQP